MHQHLNYRGPKRRKEEKGSEKIFEEIKVENFLNGKGNSHPSPRSTESPIQDKTQEKHTKTHINQINKN